MRRVVVLIAAGLWACSDEPVDPVDASVRDAGAQLDASTVDAGTPDSGEPRPYERCAEGFAGLDGEIAGEAVMLSDRYGGPRPGGAGRPQHWNYEIGASARIRASLGRPLAKGATSTAAMLAVLPDDHALVGAWLCGEALVARTNDRFTLTSTAVRNLGTCDDAPLVMGELRGCVGGAQGQSCRTLTGTVAGRTVDDDSYRYGTPLVRGVAPQRLFEIELDDGAGTLMYDEASSEGWLILPLAGGFDPGAVLCFGAGQFTEGAGQLRFSIGAFRRLGTCADAIGVAGRLDLCVQHGP